MNFSYTPVPVYTKLRLVVAQNVRIRAQWCTFSGVEGKKCIKTMKIWKPMPLKLQKSNTTGKKLSLSEEPCLLYVQTLDF